MDPAYIVDGVLTDGEAWVGIATTTLGSATTSVTFTSTDDGQVGDFSQYIDLVLICYGQSKWTGGTGCTLRVHMNGVETGDKYPTQYLSGNGSTATASADATADWFDAAEWPSDTDGATKRGSAVVHFFDINSGKYKSMLSQYAGDRDGSGYVGLNACTYKDQAAITSVTIKIRRGAAGLNIADGSTFSLFGILPRMVA
ncbi:MAG: hypothetical protein HOD33_05675 [Acidiferrobacteraceae bacterium]|nr:hypothetical protein [Acidiferrobacteraceae bacterium]